MLFYAHDGLGLGHLRRTLAVADALALRRPDAALLVLVGSIHAGLYVLPATVDVVKLPAIEKGHLYQRLADSADDADMDEVFALREAIIGATVETFAPDLVVVDHEPAGLAGELCPALARLHAARPRPTLMVGLRDITYGPAETRRLWRSDGVYELLDHVYDVILVYGCREVFDPVQTYGFSPAAAAKTTYVGYIRRPEPVRPAASIRSSLGADNAALVVVTAGGGSDGARLIRTYLAAVRSGALPGLVSYVVTGPQLAEEERAALVDAAVNVTGLTVVPFCDDLVSYVAAADVVVTMGGYNALAEAVSTGKRPVVVPRTEGSKEQLVRAERFAELGLATMVRPKELTRERLAAAVRTELHRAASPPPVLRFDGLQGAGAVLAEALER